MEKHSIIIHGIDYDTLLEKIREIKIEYLANILGVSSGAIYSWLRGESRPPLYRLKAVSIILSEDFQEIYSIMENIDVSKIKQYPNYKQLMLYLSHETGINIQRIEMLNPSKLLAIAKVIFDLNKVFNVKKSSVK
jgi:transcriptional regulator with XRE-family HTH domain